MRRAEWGLALIAVALYLAGDGCEKQEAPPPPPPLTSAPTPAGGETKWEVIERGHITMHPGEAMTARLLVPGGFVYRTVLAYDVVSVREGEDAHSTAYVQSVVFVPDQATEKE